MLQVIIADDDLYVRQGLKAMIKWEEIGAEVIKYCKNGKEAVAVLEEQKVDLIISDVKMPFVNGVELSRLVSENYPETNVVLISAYSDFEFAQEAVRNNVREYILKPMDLEKIEELSKLVHHLALEKEMNEKLKFFCHSATVKKNIRNALDVGEFNLIYEMLSLDDKHMRASYVILKEFFWQMIDILSEYIEENGYDYATESSTMEIFSKTTDKQEIMEFTINQYSDLQHFLESDRKSNKDVVMERIKRYIDNNYTDKCISTAYLAEKFGLSNSYFSTQFKNVFSVSPTDYFTELRIKKAMRLLLDTTLPIYKIADMTGYEDTNYFIRVFKKKTNITPAEYRQQNKDEKVTE